MNKYIIHCDMDNYFASVEALGRNDLVSVPYVVSGDPKLRHGIVLSKNNIAKKYNIVTGESIYSAKQKCKDLIVINADYPKYLKYTLQAREIYKRYSNILYPYGLDESWIDVTNCCKNMMDAIEIGKKIKKEIKDETGLSVSVGISFNFIFSKLGSDAKYKNDVYVIDEHNYLEITKNLPAFSLLFIGSKTRSVLRNMNILTIGDLRNSDKNLLKLKLGKKGEMLYDFSYGDDSSFIPSIQPDEKMKSIGNCITPSKDIKNSKDLCSFIYVLSNILMKRLVKHHMKCKTVQVNLRYNDFTSFAKQHSIDYYINDDKEIFNIASHILKYVEEKDIRSIGLRVSNLIDYENEQLTLFDDNDNELDDIIKTLKNKYGDINIEHSSNLKDPEIR